LPKGRLETLDFVVWTILFDTVEMRDVWLSAWQSQARKFRRSPSGGREGIFLGTRGPVTMPENEATSFRFDLLTHNF
jgi:hypothetical protein